MERVAADGLKRIADAFAHVSEGPLRERVYHALRKAILDKDLARGDRITEADLCTALDVSRTPVREAFRTLEAEGLVEGSQSRGVVVRGVSLQDFLDIYEIREALDIMAARGAAKRFSGELEAKMNDNLDMCEFLLARERWDELRKEFRVFHELIQSNCGNQRLADMLMMLQDHSSGSTEYTQPSASHAPSTLADHRMIFTALKARDPDLAAEAARAHVDNERLELHARSA